MADDVNALHGVHDEITIVDVARHDTELTLHIIRREFQVAPARCGTITNHGSDVCAGAHQRFDKMAADEPACAGYEVFLTRQGLS